jgi:hypothetical protein
MIVMELNLLCTCIIVIKSGDILKRMGIYTNTRASKTACDNAI